MTFSSLYEFCLFDQAGYFTIPIHVRRGTTKLIPKASWGHKPMSCRLSLLLVLFPSQTQCPFRGWITLGVQKNAVCCHVTAVSLIGITENDWSPNARKDACSPLLPDTALLLNRCAPIQFSILFTLFKSVDFLNSLLLYWKSNSPGN